MTVPAAKTPRAPQVRPRLRVALQALVYEGRTIGEAAEISGMTYESVRVALQRPHVQAALTALKRERVGLESLRSFHTVTQLRDFSGSDKVRLDASKTIMTAAGDLEPERHQAPASGTVLQIVVNTQHALPEAPSSAGVIEAAPFNPATYRVVTPEPVEDADDAEG